MLKLDDTLYFSSISFNRYNDEFWNSVYADCAADGKFFIDIAKRVNPTRFVTRNGEWSLPWKQELIPGYEMPDYDPTFSKTFAEVTDERAIGIKLQIQQGKKYAVLYSGGIDSTVVLSALVKNLTTEELASIVVCASIHSIVENPTFWNNHIDGKIKVLDSNLHKYDDLIEQGYLPITGDEGDCLFGTLFGLTLYNYFDYYIEDLSPESKAYLQTVKYKISDPDVHYSKYADLIIKHLDVPTNPEFGKLLYEKYVRNIETATVPIHSLHDFFWWLIFNVKYLNCSVRGPLYLNDRVEWRTAMDATVNWFNGADYQRWSMANNNNGQKIRSTLSTYKVAAREYIWDVDHNDWYKNFKIKLESLWNIGINQNVSTVPENRRPVARVGLTKDYEMLYIDDPSVQEFYRTHLQNYKIDWR
jgi:hypothetical protein